MMSNKEIVMRLIGNITPTGDLCEDEIRFENLKNLCELVNELVTEIDDVAYDKDSCEYSKKKLGEFAYNFLSETLGIVE
jgi:hypothetical protein